MGCVLKELVDETEKTLKAASYCGTSGNGRSLGHMMGTGLGEEGSRGTFSGL